MQMLKPPTRDVIDYLAVTCVGPYLLERKEVAVTQQYKKIMDKKIVVVAGDTCYDSVRNAHSSTFGAAWGNMLLTTLVDTTSPAAKKEGLLVRSFIAQAEDKGLDLASRNSYRSKHCSTRYSRSV